MSTYNLENASIDAIFGGLNLTPQKMSNHINGSLKRTAQRVQTQTIKDIAAAVKLPQKDIRKRVRTRFYQGSFGARISYYVKPMNLIRFKARQNKYGVTSRIMSVRSAFIATMPSGNEVVMKRRGRNRLPIDPVKVELSGVSSAAIDRVKPKQVADWFFTTLKQRANWERSKQ